MLLDGVDVRRIAQASLRRSVVLVPQEGFLFDDTLAANVRYGRLDATEDEILASAAELGLGDWLAGLPARPGHPGRPARRVAVGRGAAAGRAAPRPPRRPRPARPRRGHQRRRPRAGDADRPGARAADDRPHLGHHRAPAVHRRGRRRGRRRRPRPDRPARPARRAGRARTARLRRAARLLGGPAGPRPTRRDNGRRDRPSTPPSPRGSSATPTAWCPRRPAARHRRGADARLDGRRGAAPHPDHRPGDVLEPLAGRSTGSRARPPATASGSRRSGSTATATRCWSRSTRRARPATPATRTCFDDGLHRWLSAGARSARSSLVGLGVRRRWSRWPATRPGRRPAEGQGDRRGGRVGLRAPSASAKAPLATALALVVLAAWGVLLVTRGRFRRVVAGLLAVVAVGLLVAVVGALFAAPDAVADAYAPYGITDIDVQRTAWFWLALVGAMLALGGRRAGRARRRPLARDGQAVRRARRRRAEPRSRPSGPTSTSGRPWTRVATPPSDARALHFPRTHVVPTRSPHVPPRQHPGRLDRRRRGAASASWSAASG